MSTGARGVVLFVAALGSCVALLPMKAIAQTIQCVPKSGTARILQSPNPNDVDPHWRRDSSIGTSWTFVRESSVRTEVGLYFVGKLISPRGGVQQPIFILPDEWNNCQ